MHTTDKKILTLRMMRTLIMFTTSNLFPQPLLLHLIIIYTNTHTRFYIKYKRLNNNTYICILTQRVQFYMGHY